MKLDQQLETLATLSPAQLRGAWLQTFKATPPQIGHRLLALDIAYRRQADVLGDLPSTKKRELKSLLAHFAKTGTVEADAAATLKTGTRLVRDWNGKAHHVLIRDDGYVYEDRLYRSLSEIARVITGAKWSGPRFFGLKSKGAKR